MSQANQVAVAGPSSLNLADPSHSTTSRNGQHQIPRFLLKLYEIINDPANEELIKWSEAGDSFYIHNHERFAREVLGKWFKHQNFSSFVRQLNLYGFRKISALQQGLLRMEHDNETIQFAHPYFHRGQPDLLALIQRKRHPPSHTHVEEAASLLQGSQDGKLTAPGVDVHSIVEGINAIRRQQQIIASDLHALKQSNDALWKEAIEARQRHAKHEDTINRILKFLAGLFGRVTQGHGEDQQGEGQRAPKGRMLMIGDGRPSHGETGSDFGGSDFDGHTDGGSRGGSPFTTASERFATIETPAASAASPLHSPPATEAAQPLHLPNSSSNWNPPNATSASALGLHLTPSSTAASASTHLPSAPAPIPAAPNPEAMWQSTFQQMLQSPDQFQRIAQSFANAQQHPIPGPQPGPEQPLAPDFATALQVPPYNAGANLFPTIPQQVTYPPGSFPAQLIQPSQPPSHPASSYALPVMHPAGGPAPTAAEHALLENNARMQKAYRDTAEINADMDVLQSNIHSLIRDMGLDPHNPALAKGAVPSEYGEFPFDSWLEQLGGPPEGAGAVPDLAYPGEPEQGGDDLSAYLNMPVAGDVGLPPVATASSPAGQKRKLDDAEIPKAPLDVEAPASKKKR